MGSMGTDMINDNTIINKYYTTEQRKYIYKFLKRLASDDTWDSLKVYFPDDDYDSDNNNIDVVNNDNNKEEQDNNNNVVDDVLPSTSTFDDKYMKTILNTDKAKLNTDKIWRTNDNNNNNSNNVDDNNNNIFTEIELSLMDNIPCSTEFYKYISWHNFALSMIRLYSNSNTNSNSNDNIIPTMSINIETFYDDYNGSIDKLLSFLDIPPTTTKTSKTKTTNNDDNEENNNNNL